VIAIQSILNYSPDAYKWFTLRVSLLISKRMKEECKTKKIYLKNLYDNEVNFLSCHFFCTFFCFQHTKVSPALSFQFDELQIFVSNFNFFCEWKRWQNFMCRVVKRSSLGWPTQHAARGGWGLVSRQSCCRFVKKQTLWIVCDNCFWFGVGLVQTDM